MVEPSIESIAILGGTGKLGTGLAGCFARNGIPVVLGSRSIEKAEKVAAELNGQFNGANISGADYRNAILSAPVVVLSVPYPAHEDLITDFRTELAGKLIIDVVVPLNPKSRAVFTKSKFGSAALEARHILGEDAQIVDAFQHIGAEHFHELSNTKLDVLVCGSPQHARATVIELVNRIGFHPVDAGPIENSIIVEGFTSLLIHMNKTYKKNGLGIKIQGL